MPKEKADKNKNNDQSLREHLLDLLKGGGAHAAFDDVVKDFPPKLRGVKPEKFPHTAWMLLEHIRIAQADILEFCNNADYAAPKWPDDYWPKEHAPATADAWEKSIKQVHKDLQAMQDLVSNPKTDLFARITWGDGQTILREALLVADHNAYHLAQIVDLRRLLGAWK
jgi:hypothetical protein